MKYFIKINSWNLLESFSTESVSPYSFYRERNFGNNLSRYMDVSAEKTNYLILSEKDLGGDYSISIDDSLLDKESLQKIENSNGLYTYSKTIYYKKGFVQFRVSDKEKLNALTSESKILFEIKCIEKYLEDFSCSEVKEIQISKKINSEQNFSFEKQTHILNDNYYNLLKGALVGYTRGLLTTADSGSLLLSGKIRDLKNNFTGLHTHIMVNDSEVENPASIFYLIRECKEIYNNQKCESTNLFDILEHQFSEIINLAQKRALVLRENKDGDAYLKIAHINDELQEIQNEIYSLEEKNNIVPVRQEYESIKSLEKANGEKLGRHRLFFKKGTEMYDRKQYLKKQISDFEENNQELKSLLNKQNDMKDKLMNLENHTTQFDNSISAIFVRISDIMNDIIKKTNMIEESRLIDYTKLQYESGVLRFNSENVYSEELEYFNILLNYILNNHSSEPVSDFQIMDIIINTARLFKDTEFGKTDVGTRILNYLRTFWAYKNHKALKFEIPDDMPLLRSVMAFFVKPFGFDQMERYMLNKKILDKCYAFMLWGAILGYASLPKTFTNVLYKDGNYIEMDEYLFGVLHKL